MGRLRHYNLSELIEKHNLKVFVETGIGDGHGIEEALKHPFQQIFSIEIMPLQVERMREKFKDQPRVTVVEGDTLTELPKLLQSIDGNICFWLDAHFPGADIGMGKHDDPTIPDDTRLPLERELSMIRDSRKGKDVILFDDLKIYRCQGSQVLRQDIKPRQKFSSDHFYAELLESTHDFHGDELDTGYATLTPKL